MTVCGRWHEIRAMRSARALSNAATANSARAELLVEKIAPTVSISLDRIFPQACFHSEAPLGIPRRRHVVASGW